MATRYSITINLTDEEKEKGQLKVDVATKGQMIKVAESLGKDRVKVVKYTASEVTL